MAGDRGARPVALASRNPESQTVTLVLDATTASIAMHAIAAHADEREAHIREVERFGQSLPKAPTAAATARPSLPARHESPPVYASSSTPTVWPSNATPNSGRWTPPG